jgi:hypothetical protein
MHERLLLVRHGRHSQVSIRALAHGKDGNEQTLRVAAAWVREDSASDAQLRQFVLEHFISQCAPGDYLGAVTKLFEFSRDAIRFADDPEDVERIADAWSTIADGWGDCGDKSILLASMLGVIGIPSQFIVQEWEGDVIAENGFDHVHIEAFMPDGSTLQLDPTPRSAMLGWEAPSAARMRFVIWPKWSAARTGLGGPSIWDELLPKLVNTGVSFGSQYAQTKLQQSRQSQATKEAEKQINTQWESLVAAALPIFQNVSARMPNITAADFSAAASAYQALESFVSEYPTEYVTQQWTSDSYKNAALHDLNLYQAALTAKGIPLPQTAAPAATPTTGSQSWLDSPYVLIGLGGLLLIMMVKK